MLRADPQPPDQRDPAWLLRSGMAWALTGAVVTVDHRPPWYALGVALMVLRSGVVGRVVRGAAARATATAADPGRGDGADRQPSAGTT
jgi:hypothetical protein